MPHSFGAAGHKILAMARILVVEDSPDIAELLRHYLERAGHFVEQLATGREVLAHSQLTAPDVILLDVMLPDRDGMTVCQQLRSDRTTSAIPILMLTARGEPENRVEGLDSGADDYLPKPYHFPEFLARVRALLRRGPALTPAVLSYHDLTIDTRARRVERGGYVVPLTAKEYALLEYLLRRQGDVVGRAEIAEHVWDDSFDPMSNLIEVYIQRLRRKIDDGQPVKLIQTRRGAGYSLAVANETGAAED